MEKWVIAIFIVLLIIVTIVLLVIFYMIRKGVRFVKRVITGDVSEEEFERLSKKHQNRKKESPSFDNDYFKGASSQKNQQQRHQARTQRTTRTTTNGVTIVDNRDPNEASKKIFAPDEGEYVDFTEN